MVSNEKKLAEAIKYNSSYICLSESLCNNISRIIEPSQVVWMSVIGGIASIMLAIGNGFILFVPGALPFILTTGGVVATSVLTVLGGKGMLCAIKLAHAAGGVDILTKIRDKYCLDDKKHTLIKK